MLPLWWPRTACVYCGARIANVNPQRMTASGGGTRERAILNALLRVQFSRPSPTALACDRHAALVPADPLLQP